MRPFPFIVVYKHTLSKTWRTRHTLKQCANSMSYYYVKSLENKTKIKI